MFFILALFLLKISRHKFFILLFLLHLFICTLPHLPSAFSHSFLHSFPFYSCLSSSLTSGQTFFSVSSSGFLHSLSFVPLKKKKKRFPYSPLIFFVGGGGVLTFLHIGFTILIPFFFLFSKFTCFLDIVTFSSFFRLWLPMISILSFHSHISFLLHSPPFSFHSHSHIYSFHSHSSIYSSFSHFFFFFSHSPIFFSFCNSPFLLHYSLLLFLLLFPIFPFLHLPISFSFSYSPVSFL
ncbi:unnamed protein product [Acanthosepion pharaonis]|uniref:Uncharacterized protein n=1 Tax=Acanthosepion pharaonis TaxID=158019 RepID=A0A812DVU5_ACAPH|nr:unnamed protein product [Sepia pharaonis]